MTDQIQLFDSHLHIIDTNYPLVQNNGYIPDTFTCEDYLKKTLDYNLVGGAVVSGSFQAFDQSYLVAALEKLGTGFVGVTQLPVTVSDESLIYLDTAGVRGLRFNLRRGGSETLKHLSSMARRVHELVGWHVELYVDSKYIPELYEMLIKLPAVSIDHLGLSKYGLKDLLKLAEKGVRIKATGFSRVNFAVADVIKAVYEVNPSSLMFGTDLPSTRAPEPYTDNDFKLVVNTLGAEKAGRITSRNALEFYRLT